MLKIVSEVFPKEYIAGDKKGILIRGLIEEGTLMNRYIGRF